MAADAHALIFRRDDQVHDEGMEDAIADGAAKAYQTGIVICGNRIPAMTDGLVKAICVQVVLAIPAGSGK